jgi:hypothetical protein
MPPQGSSEPGLLREKQGPIVRLRRCGPDPLILFQHCLAVSHSNLVHSLTHCLAISHSLTALSLTRSLLVHSLTYKTFFCVSFFCILNLTILFCFGLFGWQDGAGPAQSPISTFYVRRCEPTGPAASDLTSTVFLATIIYAVHYLMFRLLL